MSIIFNLAFRCFSLNPIFRTAGIIGHSILVVYGCLFSSPVFLFVCLSPGMLVSFPNFRFF